MTARIVHVTVHGRVQGVGFRAWVHHHAELNGLEGWVRNRRDGTVEAVFSGPDNLVETMLKACRQGPSGSVVERLETSPGDEGMIRQRGSGRFEVLSTL